MKQKQNPQNYLQQFIRWQSEQNLPGSFLGGDLPPAYLAKTKAGGIALLLTGCLSLMIGIMNIFFQEEIINKIGFGILLGTVGILQLIAGRKFLINNKSNE